MSARRAPRVLVLAGLDGSARAGLLADAEAVRALGAEPVLAATSIAAQSSSRLVASIPLRANAVRAQVVAAIEDGAVAAVKLGALGSREVVAELVALLDGPLRGSPLVFDPVWETSRGGRLYDGELDDLLPLLERCALVTPNLAEAALLGGLEVNDAALMPEAASRVALRGARAVLLKGGHLRGPPADLLLERGELHWFRGERSKRSKRGTGCRLSSAIAARLACGDPLPQAVERGIAYVREYLEA